MAATKTKKKPILFFTAFPAEGHANPLIKVAHGLVARGYEVVFHLSRAFESRVVSIGATFAEAPDMPGPEFMAELAGLPLGLKYGRPPPPGFEHDGFPKVIGLSATMLAVRSQDTAPYFLGLPPDSTESGRLRNKALEHICEYILSRFNTTIPRSRISQDTTHPTLLRDRPYPTPTSP